MQGCVNHAFLFSVFLILWHLGFVDSLATVSPKVRQFLEIYMTFLGACFSHASYTLNFLPYQTLTLYAPIPLP